MPAEHPDRDSSPPARCAALCCRQKSPSECGVAADAPSSPSPRHDTASRRGRRARSKRTADFAYISSGTWSLLGAELKKPPVPTRRSCRPTTPTRAACAAPSACSRTSWACGSSRSASAPGIVEGADDRLRRDCGNWPEGRARLQGRHRRGRPLLPGAGRHAGAHPGLLPPTRTSPCPRPAAKSPAWCTRVWRSSTAGPSSGWKRIMLKKPDRRAAHRGRRQQERNAQPLHRRGHRPEGGRRARPRAP